MKTEFKFKPKRPKPIAGISIHRLSELFRLESEIIQQYKERTMQLTAEQKLEVLRLGAEQGYILIPYRIGRDSWQVKIYGTPETVCASSYNYCFDTLAHIVKPEWFEPDWRDDGNWQELITCCKRKSIGFSCGFGRGIGLSYKQGYCEFANCEFKNGNHVPCNPDWQPPTDPATGKPYPTYELWKAAQAKPAEPSLPVLKPCAHCGGEVRIWRAPLGWTWRCSRCFLTDNIEHSSEQICINDANRRPALPEGLTREDIEARIKELVPGDFPPSAENRWTAIMLKALLEMI